MKAPLIVVLGLLALPAGAESLRATHLHADGASGCFLRQYSRDHMAAHPAQMVTLIALGRTGGDPWAKLQPVRLMAMFRSGDSATVEAWCRDGGPGMVCSAEGDAGTFTLEARSKGAIVLEPVGGGLVLEGAADFHMLSPTTGDDRSFLLPPVPADACP